MMHHTQNLHFDGRAAPNVGIYNRVCKREQQAKRSYKFASVFINSCLGIQVIVAAALTAMGAAKSSHVAITAFGAINTVIAGLLTYLKGSGLPNRIRWYENEWKKIREYIEQRERDFSRPDCNLDVERVVAAIEAMYEEVKVDIQNNTPEMYISVSDLRNRGAAATNPMNLRDMTKGGQNKGMSKLEELELKYGHKVADLLENLAHKEEARLSKLEATLDSTKGRAVSALHDEKDMAIRGARDWEKEMEDKGRLAAEREMDHAMTGARDFEKDIESKGRAAAEREIEHARTGVSSWQDKGMRMAETTRSSFLQKGVDFARDLDTARTSATQRGRDYERELEAKAARLAEAQRELEREAQRVKEAAQRASDSAQRAGDQMQRAGESVERASESVQRVGDSVQRVGKAVDDEIQPARRG